MSDRAPSTKPTPTFWADGSENPGSQYYRALVDAVDGGVFQLDAANRLVAVDDALLELTGHDRDAVLDEPVSVLLETDAVPRLERRVRARTDDRAPESENETAGADADRRRNAGTGADGKSVATLELDLRTVDGASVPCEVRLNVFRVDEGDSDSQSESERRDGNANETGRRRRAVIGIVRERDEPGEESDGVEYRHDDAQEHAATTPVLADADPGSLAPVLDEADVGIFVLDADRRVAWANETIERYFGLERAAVLGRDKHRVIEESIQHRTADPEGFRDTVLSTYDDGTDRERFECRVTAGDERDERWLEHRSRPIESGPYAGGRIECYYDVTDRHRRIDQLRRLNAAVRDWLEADSNEEAAERACRSLRETLGLEINGVFTYDSERDALRPVRQSEPAATLFEEPPTFERGEGIAWRAFESGEPELSGDVRSDPDVYNPETPIRSELVLPVGDYGVVIAGSRRPDAFDEGTLSIAEIAASSLETAFDRIETERRLQRRKHDLETELSEILGRVSDGFYALDEEWRFTHVNERAEELLGYPREELVGEVVWDVFPGGTRSELIDRYHEAMETQRSISWERYSGSLEIWMEIQIYPSETGLSVYFRDITERRERQRKLEEREQRYRTLAENFPNGVVTLYDEDLRYTLVDGKGFEDLPQSATDLEGRRPSDVFPTPVGAELEELFERSFDGERLVRKIEYEGQVWRVQAATITDEDGDVLSGMAIAQDVTERKEYERRLEASNERLEQFAYAASHDLQEPLRMVTSYLQLLERRYADDLDDDAAEFIDYAVDGAERMREMIDGLLEYSRIETQGEPLEPVDLNGVLADVRQDLELRIEESDAEIVAESLPRVRGDAGQLRQVFQNLLSNAIEYSGEGAPTIEISASREGTMWEISVADEGIGIDPEQTDRVFEVFQRLHSREEHAGTGIGLTLCKRIVERHDGEIRIDSTPGEGTTVSVTLPVVAGDSQEAESGSKCETETE
ncbi:PAS domain-containing protein [Halopiger xanaduensis]|uniref:histidine kinase n=1 Tax=Halopiger xanaduensis (strain DSM 18323 / JCM 14033 / SH-6) TaxID=797210 RepID=F8DCQ0_HALXS|nr:PAS domain-containing protein [Halopiger xanaduensis]AEH37224.1 multi-sensor signal transduction histidine kinase [Halopiger xanaduensis SH-6]